MTEEVIRTGSYTALRLYNEIPRDVSTQSCVLFVGSVPKDWIRKNKRNWGKWKHLKRILPTAMATATAVTSEDSPKKPNRVQTINDELLCSSTNTDTDQVGGPLDETVSETDDYEGIASLGTERSLTEIHPWQDDDHSNVSEDEAPTEIPQEPRSRATSFASSRCATQASSTRPLLADQLPTTADDKPQYNSRGQNGQVENSSFHSETETSDCGRSQPIMVPQHYPSDREDTSLTASNVSFFTARSSISESRPPTQLHTPEPFAEHLNLNNLDLIDFDDQSTIQLGSARDHSDGQQTIDLSHSPRRGGVGTAPAGAVPNAEQVAAMHHSGSDITEDGNVSPGDNSLHSYRPQESDPNHEDNDIDGGGISPSTSLASSRRKITQQMGRVRQRIAKSGATIANTTSTASRLGSKRLSAARRNDLVRRTERLLRRKEKGEVVMIEKMLVLVKEASQVVPLNFNEVEKVDTTIVDRWKEYVVAARNTKDPESPIALKFYKSRSISRVEDQSGGHSEFGIKISRSICINLYSALDKTFVLWNTDHRANIGMFSRLARSSRIRQTSDEPEMSNKTLLYIIKAKSDVSALNWLTFLAGVIGIAIPKTIEVRVPNLGMTAELDMPLYTGKRRDMLPKIASEFTSYNDIKKFTSARSHLLAGMVDSIVANANEISALREFISEHWTNRLKIGLCWKRYDRLEWLFDLTGRIDSAWAMFRTHDLELRPKMPAAQPVIFPDGSRMEEPIPIEGFLHRLSTWEGKARRQKMDTRIYMHSHDNLLFYCAPFKAIPPVYDEDTSDVPIHPRRSRRSSNESPEIFKVNPFPLDAHGDVRWLKDIKSVDDFDRHDQKALFEMKRRVASIHNSDGVIDMTRIKLVKSSSSHQDSQFELLFTDGLILRLEATSPRCKDAWVSVLTSHIIYWKQRLRQDVQRVSYIKKQNMELLHVDEASIGFIEETQSKWITDRTRADPFTYNIGPLSWSKSVNMRGIVFQKPHKYATFHKYYLVLTQVGLILYQPVERHTSGAVKKKMNMVQIRKIDIDDCYVYSGPVTSGVLLQRDRGVNPENPGRHEQPRVYEDGWKSAEEETMRCFVLWFGMKRPLASTKSESRANRAIKHVNRLGTGGKSMTFIVRSRQERDLWVSALNIVISRNAQRSYTDDIVVQD